MLRTTHHEEARTGEETKVQYVYHRKSPDFVGTWVVPLNKMPTLPNFETTYKPIYEKEKRKYIGREFFMECRVPPLGNCKWNDVIFLSPMHPHYVYKEFQKVGISTEQCGALNFYKIPITKLNLDPAVTTLWSHPSSGDQFAPDCFSRVDAETYRELDALPDDTKKHFHVEFARGRSPLLFGYVPHVMTTEPIEVTSDTCVIDWKNPRL